MSVRITSSGQPRLRNGVAALVSVGVVTAATIGALYTGLIGQSNMVHRSSDYQGFIHYYITGLLSQRWTAAGLQRIDWYDSSGHVAPGTTYSVAASGPYASTLVHAPGGDMPGIQGGDGICNFVNGVTIATGLPIVTFEYAQIGVPIESWLDDGTNNCWATFKAAVLASGKPLNSAFLLQGEDNANKTTTKDSYKGSLRKLHDQLLALAGMTGHPETFYFAIDILGPGTTYAPEGRMGVIRQAQLEYIAENIGAYMGSVATDMDLAGDQIHFDGKSQSRMGARDAKSLAAWAKGAPVKWPGPKIAYATSSNGGLTVTVTTTGGVGALKDGAGGNGSALLGWRFFDASGTLIPYTASVISGGTIVFTLASAGVATMDYGMANAPFGGTTAPASVVYDSDTISGDTNGNPVIPCATITVN